MMCQRQEENNLSILACWKITSGTVILVGMNTLRKQTLEIL